MHGDTKSLMMLFSNIKRVVDSGALDILELAMFRMPMKSSQVVLASFEGPEAVIIADTLAETESAAALFAMPAVIAATALCLELAGAHALSASMTSSSVLRHLPKAPTHLNFCFVEYLLSADISQCFRLTAAVAKSSDSQSVQASSPEASMAALVRVSKVSIYVAHVLQWGRLQP